MSPDDDLIDLLRNAKGRPGIGGRNPGPYASTICIRLTENDRRELIAALEGVRHGD